ncbi:MAG TPA: DUF2214 family protein [Gemmatimonadaceae bacterium]|nr:DUF2214 family protein [Gemmatimonadaceae bacterium]
MRISLAVVHLLALGIGLGAIWSRARSFGAPPDTVAALRRGFTADSWWGIAAILWIASGLWRLLGATEKPALYYAHNRYFIAKMAGLVLILLLELWPMVTLIRWRVSTARGTISFPTIARPSHRISLISYTQTAIVILMVILAVSMARGYS